MFASDRQRQIPFFQKVILFVLKKSFLLAILFFLYTLFFEKNWEHYFPIREVSVYGIHELKPDEIKQAVLPFLSQGFFTLPLEAVKDHLEYLPWVASVVVKKVWPEHLHIWLEEKKAVAIWNQNSLLLESGELFKPELKNYPKKLPKLVGMHGNHAKILRQYILFKKHLHTINQNVVYVEETPFSDWKVQLENGMVLYIGEDASITRLQRLIDVYADVIGDRVKQVDYVDLRYANGIAVRWKNGLNSINQG